MLDFDSLTRFKNFKFEILRLLPEWAQAYEVSEAAILRQIPIAHAWCNANPKKAPKKDPVRFLFNWMRLAKKMNNLVDKPVNISYKERAPDGEVMTGEDFRQMREALRGKK